MRRVIIYKEGENIEVFSSLKKFFDKYPSYLTKKSSVEKILAKKDEPFVCEEFTLVRLFLQ